MSQPASRPELNALTETLLQKVQTLSKEVKYAVRMFIVALEDADTPETTVNYRNPIVEKEFSHDVLDWTGPCQKILAVQKEIKGIHFPVKNSPKSLHRSPDQAD